jgi:hypothetical protein
VDVADGVGAAAAQRVRAAAGWAALGVGVAGSLAGDPAFAEVDHEGAAAAVRALAVELGAFVALDEPVGLLDQVLEVAVDRSGEGDGRDGEDQLPDDPEQVSLVIRW